MIVKAQLAIAGHGAGKQVLIYNKDQSVFWQGEPSQDIVDLLQDKKKAYFTARLIDTKINLEAFAPDQEW